MHHHHHDTIPSFTQTSPALEAAPTDIPPAFEKVSPSSYYYYSLVLGHLPDMYKTKGRVLLHHPRNAGVKWSNKEVISRYCNGIAGSNAVDLVREALVGSCRLKQNYVEPSGWGKCLLREANVPRSLFGKRKTLRQL